MFAAKLIKQLLIIYLFLVLLKLCWKGNKKERQMNAYRYAQICNMITKLVDLSQ